MILEVDPVSVDSEPLDWYIVRALTGYEQRVVLSLEKTIKVHKLEDFFGEIIVPTESVVEMYDGKQRKVRRRFFPGYFLIQMRMNEHCWHVVRKTAHVLGFLGGAKGKPKPINQMELDAIFDRMSDKDHVKTSVLLEAGEVVRVKEGPFSGFDAVVESVNYDKQRVYLSVTIFGRSTPVDLDFSQVEKS